MSQIEELDARSEKLYSQRNQQLTLASQINQRNRDMMKKAFLHSSSSKSKHLIQLFSRSWGMRLCSTMIWRYKMIHSHGRLAKCELSRQRDRSRVLEILLVSY